MKYKTQELYLGCKHKKQEFTSKLQSYNENRYSRRNIYFSHM